MSHGNEEWCKNCRGTDFSVKNWHEEFDEVWPEHSKVSNICTLMTSFLSKHVIMTMKIDAKFEGKLTCAFNLCFQKWHKQFGKFLLTGWNIAISF